LPFVGNDKHFGMENLALITESHISFFDPFQLQDGVPGVSDQRVRLLGIRRGGSCINEAGQATTKSVDSVANNVDRKKNGRHRVKPPSSCTNSKNSATSCKPCHPVGLVHIRIGMEHLIMQ